MDDMIRVTGASEHNLKHIDVVIPRNRLTVVTGVSGSGKSSLAFDTLFAEGQRRYVESLSAYARQFLDQLQKPAVERIEGLSPAIAIEQRASGSNPRSIVATATEIHDYLRLLYANAGQPHCPDCGAALQRTSADLIAERLMDLPEGVRLMLLAPLVRAETGSHRKTIERIRQRGYLRVRVNGEVVELETLKGLPAAGSHSIDVVVDRLAMGAEGLRSRLTDSVELALKEGEGELIALYQDGIAAPWTEMRFSEDLCCDACHVRFAPLTARSFSFNSPQGACPVCDGLGTELVFDPELLIPDPGVPLDKGAIPAWRSGGRALIMHYRSLIKSFAAHFGITPDVPFSTLTEEQRQMLMYGSGETGVVITKWRQGVRRRRQTVFEGVVPNLKRRLRETDSEVVRQRLRRYMTRRTCPACHGGRLRPESAACAFRDMRLPALLAWPIERAHAFFGNLVLTGSERQTVGELIREVQRRLHFLRDAGLGYLALDRQSGTLSGGEAQRLRLATQIGSALTGVLYVLDEPTIGLHERDNARLIAILWRLRDLGNTLVVVEHDEAMIRAADHVIDLGPAAGAAGGEVMFSGPVAGLLESANSPTARYLRGEEPRYNAFTRRVPGPAVLRIEGARANNLKNIDVEIPLGLLVCVTGVSGSGKSTLVDDVLSRALFRHFYKSSETPGVHRAIRGLEQIDKAVVIDQSPIGRTPRSNPATYTGAFDVIRRIFAATPSAKVRGYGPGRFSFNVKGGRCEVCRGDGQIRLEMHFLPDVYVTCERCRGLRYNRETLDVTYGGHNIAEVLALTVDEGLAFFANVPLVARRLRTLYDVGLGYLQLGQPATTLSGGEAQRVKLASELSKVATGRTLYLLDEPTTGLHFADVRQLLAVLVSLRDQGNTVLIIEHNPDVIRCSDYIIDLGPEGGEDGGRVVAAGPPELIAESGASHTGRMLRALPLAGRCRPLPPACCMDVAMA